MHFKFETTAQSTLYRSNQNTGKQLVMKRMDIKTHTGKRKCQTEPVDNAFLQLLTNKTVLIKSVLIISTHFLEKNYKIKGELTRRPSKVCGVLTGGTMVLR